MWSAKKVRSHMKNPAWQKTDKNGMKEYRTDNVLRGTL